MRRRSVVGMPNTPQIIRAQPITWSANTTAPVNLAFLDSAKGRSPQVSALYAQVTLSCTTGTAGGTGSQLPQFLSRIVLADGSGERINLSGASLRLLNCAEAAFGSGFDDPDDVAASTSSAVSISFFVRLPVIPRSTSAHREADFYMSVRELRDGGRLELTFGSANPGSANGWTIASGTVTWYAEIVDAAPALTSRLVLREQVMSQVDDVYSIGGALRWALPYVGATNENLGTAWSTQTLDSFTLDYSQIPGAVFTERYKQQFPALYTRASATANTVGVFPTSKRFLDPIVLGYAVPFVQPDVFGKTSQLRFIESVLHYRTSLASFSNNPLMVTSVVQPRTARAAIVATGSPAAVASGAVRDGKIAGSDTTASTVGPRAASVMPIDLKR